FVVIDRAAAVEQIVTVAAVNGIGAGAADDEIARAAAGEIVVAAVAEEDVVRRVAEHGVAKSRAEHHAEIGDAGRAGGGLGREIYIHAGVVIGIIEHVHARASIEHAGHAAAGLEGKDVGPLAAGGVVELRERDAAQRRAAHAPLVLAIQTPI